VEVSVGDTIIWKSADSTVHTVTSRTVSEGLDDIFDSNLFGSGKSFTHHFIES